MTTTTIACAVVVPQTYIIIIIHPTCHRAVRVMYDGGVLSSSGRHHPLSVVSCLPLSVAAQQQQYVVRARQQRRLPVEFSHVPLVSWSSFLSARAARDGPRIVACWRGRAIEYRFRVYSLYSVIRWGVGVSCRLYI